MVNSKAVGHLGGSHGLIKNALSNLEVVLRYHRHGEYQDAEWCAGMARS